MPFDNWFNFDFCCFRYDLSSIETLDPEVAKELIRNWQIEKSRPKAMAKELIAQTGEKNWLHNKPGEQKGEKEMEECGALLSPQPWRRGDFSIIIKF